MVGESSGEVGWPILEETSPAPLVLRSETNLGAENGWVDAGSENEPVDLWTTPSDPSSLLIANADPAKKPVVSKPAQKGHKFFEYSGHVRTRWESKQNFDFIYNRPSVQAGKADNDDNFFLTRVRVNLDLRPNPFLQAHVTLQDSRLFGSHQISNNALDRRGRNIFQNKTDLHEAWLKLKLGEAPMWLQAGRMQLNYGDQRLIGGFNWSNNARAFDAVRFIYDKDDFRLDLVAANVVVVDSNAWDNHNGDDDLLMAYGTLKNLPQGTQDLYLIYRDNDEIHREIYTLGSRINGKSGPIDWNLEGAYQWGTSVDTVAPTADPTRFLDHEAYAAHAELGYTCLNSPYKPRLAAGYDFATGDKDPNDGENNTFDNLFPTNHLHYGYMDFFSWRNINSPYLKLSWLQTKRLKIKTHWHLFWLDQERNDAMYNAGGGVVRNAAGADVSSFAGHELDIVATCSVRKDLKVELGYGHFFAQNYIADTSPDGDADDADFVYLQTVWSF